MPGYYEAPLRHARYYENLLYAANELYKQGGEITLKGLAFFDREWLNIQDWHSWGKAKKWWQFWK